MRYLPREDAPFGDAIWKLIDEAVLGAAKSQLAGRRLLEISGPYGLGARSIDAGESDAEGQVTRGDLSASLSAASAIPIPAIRAEFTLHLRDIAAVEERSAPLYLGDAANAGIACAHLEDQLVFQGSKALGIHGLLTAAGVAKAPVGDWTKVGQAADDVIAAVNMLDEAGFAGPYAAALAPNLYNALFLRYQQGNQTQLDHVKQIVTAGLVKAPTLQKGGVLIAADKRFATIALGQDMTVGFIGPAGDRYELVVIESLCPRVLVPESVCVLEPGK